MGSFSLNVRKIFRKTNNSYPLLRTRTCAYQEVRITGFSENFAYILNACPRLQKSSLLYDYFDKDSEYLHLSSF